jgi:hypothetical protein
MRLRNFPIVITAALSLSACIGLIYVRAYTAADGSTQTGDGNCLTRPPPSTVVLDRPEVHVRLYVIEVPDRSNTFSASINVRPQRNIEARLSKTAVKIDSQDFRESLVADARIRSSSNSTSYEFSVSMPTVANELSISFPSLEVQGQVVELRSLVLRSERRLQPIWLACQA